jgi:RNase H-fold protein (predicted Holliday junction resolvase)
MTGAPCRRPGPVTCADLSGFRFWPQAHRRGQWQPLLGTPAAGHHQGRGRRALAQVAQKRIAEWQPDALVVGVPYHPDGASHENTARAQRFARQLRGRFGLPVFEVDERYSTTEAWPTARAMPMPARPASSWNSS